MIVESRKWTLSDIKRLIDDRERESTYLEYKSSGALQNNEHSRKQLSKFVSSFANAGGGTIIYGVEEGDHFPFRIDGGVDPGEISKEWLEQVMISTIHRKVEGVIIHQIDLENERDDNVIYAVQVPQSNRAPHQASDRRFYTRRNFLSEPMEEYEVRDVMMRENRPDLYIELYLSRHGARIEEFLLDTSNPDTTHGLEINGIIGNDGGGEVQFAVISLYFDNRLQPQHADIYHKVKTLKTTNDTRTLEILKTDINWSGFNKMPIFKSVEFRFLKRDIGINFQVPWLLEDGAPFIQWEIRASNMQPKTGCYRLQMRDNNLYLKPERVIEFKGFEQDDRNRDFLKNPDLSFNPNL